MSSIVDSTHGVSELKTNYQRNFLCATIISNFFILFVIWLCLIAARDDMVTIYVNQPQPYLYELDIRPKFENKHDGNLLPARYLNNAGNIHTHARRRLPVRKRKFQPDILNASQIIIVEDDPMSDLEDWDNSSPDDYPEYSLDIKLPFLIKQPDTLPDIFGLNAEFDYSGIPPDLNIHQRRTWKRKNKPVIIKNMRRPPIVLNDIDEVCVVVSCIIDDQGHIMGEYGDNGFIVWIEEPDSLNLVSIITESLLEVSNSGNIIPARIDGKPVHTLFTYSWEILPYGISRLNMKHSASVSYRKNIF